MGLGNAASWLFAPALGAISLLTIAAPGRALTTVCTAAWSAGVSAGATASGPLAGGSVPPCFSAPIAASVTVGTGANAGTLNASNVINGLGTDNFAITSPQSIDLGVQASTNEQLTLTFSQAVSNPYLFFTYTDPGDSIEFADSFVLVDSNNATKSGNVVTITGGATNSQNDGFVVQLLGGYAANASILFTYNNPNASVESVAFTAGAIQVPGPLPLMGAGVAFGFSRRLRRRIHAKG